MSFTKTWGWTLTFVLAALVMPAGWQPPALRVPVPPIPTALGSMPGVGELPLVADLPDVMTFADGRRVTTAGDWRQRREEMKRILAYYATGLMPPSPGNVQGREIASAKVLGGTVQYRLVHLSFGPERRCGFDLAVFQPVNVDGKVPAIVFPTFGPTPGGRPLPTLVRPPEQGKGVDALTVPLGDQTARAAAARAAAPAPPPGAAMPGPLPSDPESFAAARADVFRRGYALAVFHYQDAGEDTIGRETDGSWSFRKTRFFPAYPGHDWGLLASWAWGLSRAVDYLETQPFVEKDRFVAIGHSRIGKAVLVAGAFDERLAVVAPAGSGAGGTGAYRFNGTRGGGREGLADMMRKYPNWFSPNLYQFAADVDRLPFDQHWLIALVAPRAFVSLEGIDDRNCVVNALRQAVRGAAPAFDLLGARARLGVHYAAHGHALTDEDWLALLDFSDWQLRGRTPARRFDLFPPDGAP